MRTGTKIFLIILSIVIVLIALVGVDIYISFKAVETKRDEFSYTDPTYIIADNNQSATAQTYIRTPKIGYLPVKSALVKISIEKNGSEYIAPQFIKIKLGILQKLEYIINFNAEDAISIENSYTLYFKVAVTAIPIYIGIRLDFATVELGSDTIGIGY